MVTPILKKGDQKEKTNYRPVSCLAAASKVLEKIICEQITKHMETNKLLPNSQHGFREKRSKMTALFGNSTGLDGENRGEPNNGSTVLGPLSSI